MNTATEPLRQGEPALFIKIDPQLGAQAAICAQSDKASARLTALWLKLEEYIRQLRQGFTGEVS